MLGSPTASWVVAQRSRGCGGFLAVICVALAALALTVCVMTFVDSSGSGPDPPPAPAPPPSPVPVYMPECTAHEKCSDSGLTGNCCPTPEGVLLECCRPIPSNAALTPFHSMCYAPTPAKTEMKFPTDDYMAQWAQPFWGTPGRDDLSAIRAMNIDTLRLYGNDPRLNHKHFLNRAYELGISVVVAISDYPYTQDTTGKCAAGLPYNCFNEIRSQYSAMLRNGFAEKGPDGLMYYHPSIKAVILINEPELKITYNGKIAEEAWSEGYYAKALLSAIDGALAAEEDMHLHGRFPPFTVVHSFATCPTCKSNVAGNKAGEVQVGTLAALGFMYDFVVGMLSPNLYDYAPHHDLRAALQHRFLLGFNTQDITDTICGQVLQPLKSSPLSGMPVWAGEYKAWYQSEKKNPISDFQTDYGKIASWVGSSSCGGAGANLTGVSIFEFQVSYFKGTKEHQMDFGIYELGKKQIATTQKAEETSWQQYPVWCLHKKRNNAGDSWVDAVAKVLGGEALSDSDCSDKELTFQA